MRGNQRVDAETVRNVAQIKAGQNVSDADVDAAVTRLFGTGLFSDVRARQSGGSLIIEVDENQIVGEVIFQGNNKIKNEQLAATVQTATREPYNASTAQADVDAIRAAYTRIGRSDAVVSVHARFRPTATASTSSSTFRKAIAPASRASTSSATTPSATAA